MEAWKAVIKAAGLDDTLTDKLSGLYDSKESFLECVTSADAAGQALLLMKACILSSISYDIALRWSLR